MRSFKVLIAGFVAFAVSVATTSQPAAADSKDSWDKLSTALVFGLAGRADWKTLARGDKTGQAEDFESMGRTLALSKGLKAFIHNRRPDHYSNNRFPSAHTALAFAAANYFDNVFRAENITLVPFYNDAVALSLLGLVEAKKHVCGNVASRALIGVAVTHTFATAGPEARVYPTGGCVAGNCTQHF